jgi:hypothetical protein
VTSYTLRSVDSNGRRGDTRHIHIEPPPRTAPTPQADTTSGYPDDGTANAILEWVDQTDTPNRAKAAIVAEHGRSKVRTTLLAKLNERIGT